MPNERYGDVTADKPWPIGEWASTVSSQSDISTQLASSNYWLLWTTERDVSNREIVKYCQVHRAFAFGVV